MQNSVLTATKTVSTSTEKNSTQSQGRSDQVDENNSEQRSENQSGAPNQNQGSNSPANGVNGNNNPNSDPPPFYIPLPTFFDPPPPPKYEASIEVQVKKEKKHPKIIKKLVPTSVSLERKSRLFLEGCLPIEKPDFSLLAAHRKIKSLKHSFDRSGGTIRFTADTFEKAIAKDFKNILIPSALLPSKEPAFEYQYFIEDPKTGLCLSTDEIQSIYSDEELERLLQDLSAMDKEVSFSSKITTTTTKRVKSSTTGGSTTEGSYESSHTSSEVSNGTTKSLKPVFIKPIKELSIERK